MLDDLTRRDFLRNTAAIAATICLGSGGCSHKQKELTQIIEATKIPNVKNHHIEGALIVRGKEIDALGGYISEGSRWWGASNPICETFNTETNEDWSILEGANIPLARTAHFTKGEETFLIGGFNKGSYSNFSSDRLDDPNIKLDPDNYVGAGVGDFFGVPDHAAILCYNHKTDQQKKLEERFPVYIFDGKGVVIDNRSFIVGGTFADWKTNNPILYQYDGGKWSEFDRNVVTGDPQMVVADGQTIYCFTRERVNREWLHLMHTYNIHSHEKSKLKLPEEFHLGRYELTQVFVEDNAVYILGIKTDSKSKYARCVLYTSSPENDSWIKKSAFRVTSEVGAYRQFCYVNGDMFCIGGNSEKPKEYALRFPILPST